MGKIKNLEGQRFGRLLVINYSGKKAPGYILWNCQCDCGNFVIVQSNNLVSSNTHSCGCLRKDRIRETHFKHGDNRKGINGTARLYRIWIAMKERCRNKKNKYYGGRGIKVCLEWKNSYVPFKKWAWSHGYAENLTIDRINNDGDYCPENCQWLTRSENLRKGSK